VLQKFPVAVFGNYVKGESFPYSGIDLNIVLQEITKRELKANEIVVLNDT
jgi:predicted nucleotidyltransferase